MYLFSVVACYTYLHYSVSTFSGESWLRNFVQITSLATEEAGILNKFFKNSHISGYSRFGNFSVVTFMVLPFTRINVLIIIINYLIKSPCHFPLVSFFLAFLKLKNISLVIIWWKLGFPVLPIIFKTVL